MKKTICDRCKADIHTKSVDGEDVDLRNISFSYEDFEVRVCVLNSKDLCIKCIQTIVTSHTSAKASAPVTDLMETLFGSIYNPKPKKSS